MRNLVKLRALEALCCQPRRMVQKAMDEARQNAYTLLATNTLAFTPDTALNRLGKDLRALKDRGLLHWWRIDANKISPMRYEVAVHCVFDWGKTRYHEEFNINLP